MNDSVIKVEHYSDVLCIWAYVAQVRVEELHGDFGDQVDLDYRFLQVFSDVRGKMESLWADRGQLAGYAEHVQEIAGRFDHITIHPDLWVRNTPVSSMPAHLLLCAVKSMHLEDGKSVSQVAALLRSLREAFFVQLVDISNGAALFDVAADTGIDVDRARRAIASGEAHARLGADLATAATAQVRSSPTLSFNEGRQVLSGNVGYRVLEANVREALRQPGNQQSWC